MQAGAHVVSRRPVGAHHCVLERKVAGVVDELVHFHRHEALAHGSAIGHGGAAQEFGGLTFGGRQPEGVVGQRPQMPLLLAGECECRRRTERGACVTGTPATSARGLVQAIHGVRQARGSRCATAPTRVVSSATCHAFLTPRRDSCHASRVCAMACPAGRLPNAITLRTAPSHLSGITRRLNAPGLPPNPRTAAPEITVVPRYMIVSFSASCSTSFSDQPARVRSTI